MQQCACLLHSPFLNGENTPDGSKVAGLASLINKWLLTNAGLFLFAGLQSVPGDYVSRGSPMGMNMGQPSYTPPQMPPHPAQLRHGPPMHTYIPGHPHHPAMMMHGGPPHPGMPMSASSPTMLHPGEPAASGQVMDIHAQ